MYLKTSSPYLFLFLYLVSMCLVEHFLYLSALPVGSLAVKDILPRYTFSQFMSLFSYQINIIHSLTWSDTQCIYQIWLLLHKFSPILGSMWSWEDFFCRHIATIFAPLLHRGDLSVSLYLVIMPLYLSASEYLYLLVFVIFARSCLFLGLTAFGRLLH